MLSRFAAVTTIVVIALTACSAERSTATPAEIEPTVADPTPINEPAVPTSAPRPAHTIYRSELRRATNGGRPAYLLAQLAPEVHRPNGSFMGWTITQLFPDDPQLCAQPCDLAIGDVIMTVNGSPIERPEQLSALVAEIDTMAELRIRRVRDGQMTEHVYLIADD